jgi:hypothetical protein
MFGVKFPPHAFHRIAHLLERRASAETPTPAAASKPQVAATAQAEPEITFAAARQFGECLVSAWRRNYLPTALFVDTSGDMLVVSHLGAYSYRGGTWLDGAHFRPSDIHRMRRVDNAAEKYRIRFWAECACRPGDRDALAQPPKRRTPLGEKIMAEFHERTKDMGPPRQASILEMAAALSGSGKSATMRGRQWYQ